MKTKGRVRASGTRLRALDAFTHAYEVEYGEITREEIELASRRAKSRAVAVRAVAPARAPVARRRRGAKEGELKVERSTRR